MEKTVEINMPDGSKQSVTLKRIKRKERKLLNSIILTDKFNAQNPEVMIGGAAVDKYRDTLVSLSIKEPAKLKAIEALDDLDDMEFNILFSAAQEINLDTQTQVNATEKK